MARLGFVGGWVRGIGKGGWWGRRGGRLLGGWVRGERRVMNLARVHVFQ